MKIYFTHRTPPTSHSNTFQLSLPIMRAWLKENSPLTFTPWYGKLDSRLCLVVTLGDHLITFQCLNQKLQYNVHNLHKLVWTQHFSRFFSSFFWKCERFQNCYVIRWSNIFTLYTNQENSQYGPLTLCNLSHVDYSRSLPFLTIQKIPFPKHFWFLFTFT